MKRFLDSTIGIILISIIPALGSYLVLFNFTMDMAINHITVHAPAYTALLIWLVFVIILWIKRSLSKRKEKTIALIQLIQVIQEEMHLRFKNAEFNEDSWRKSLLAGLNEHFRLASYKSEKGQSKITIADTESEEIDFYKSDKRNELQKRIDELLKSIIND